jgi:hypothetical protein
MMHLIYDHVIAPFAIGFTLTQIVVMIRRR